MDNFEEEIFEEELTQDKKSGVGSVIVSALLIAMIVFLVFILGYRAFFTNIQISGDSMIPTLRDGEVYVASKLKVPDRGDLTVINVEEKRTEQSNYWIIKRVVAIEGDSVKIENGKLYLKTANQSDYVVIEEDYVLGATYSLTGKTEWVVQEDEFFFLGDNRENSADSRIYGTRRIEDIVGVVTDWSIKQEGFWYNFNKVLNFPSKLFKSWNRTTGE